MGSEVKKYKLLPLAACQRKFPNLVISIMSQTCRPASLLAVNNVDEGMVYIARNQNEIINYVE